jgi:molybdopterin synthase sulfur carrier subunit
MTLTVKFIGALRHASGKTKLTFNCKSETLTVKELILKLLEETPQLKSSLIDQQTDGSFKTNALILVNDREISVLNGIETKLSEGDEIVFVPVVHGG